jgi:localization factor PodJL
MEQPSLDALAERIARIGRRDTATSVSPAAPAEQVNRLTALIDQAVARMSQEISSVESRTADTIARSELRAAKALDSVAVWLEKRDLRDTELEQRLESRDAGMTRTMGLLVSKLEEIDGRLQREPALQSTEMRETLQTIGQRLDHVGRMTKNEQESPAVVAALRDLDQRMQQLSQQLNDVVSQPRPTVCDQTETLTRLESQLVDILGAVKTSRSHEARALYDEPSQAERDMASAIDEIAARQRKLDNEEEIFARNTERALSDLKREVGTLASRFADPAGSVASRNEVRAEIAAIGHALHDLAPRRQVNNVEMALRDLAAKVEASRSEGTRESLLAPIERLLTDIRLNLESFRDTDALDQINARLSSLQKQMDATGQNTHDSAATDALSRQLGEIRSLLADGSSGPALNAIEDRLADIGARLDDVVERSPSRERDPDIADAIHEIRTLLDRADPSRAIAEVENKLAARMQEHSRAMEARFVARESEIGQSKAVTGMVDRLSNRLDAIQTALDSKDDHQDDFARIVRQVEMLEDKIDSLPDRNGDQQEEFARIARQMAMLEDKIDSLPDRNGDHTAIAEMVRQLALKVEAVESRLPDVMGLAEIVHKLADQVDTAMKASPSTHVDLAPFEAQIAAIAARLDRPMEGDAALPALEKAVHDLFSQMESLKLGGAETASAAAREAVDSALSALSPANFAAAANEGVAALASDIQAMRNQQNEADLRSQHTLASVHDTLAKIVDRLAMLETDIAEARSPMPEAEAAYDPAPIAMDYNAPSRFGGAPVAYDVPEFDPEQGMQNELSLQDEEDEQDQAYQEQLRQEQAYRDHVYQEQLRQEQLAQQQLAQEQLNYEQPTQEQLYQEPPRQEPGFQMQPYQETNLPSLSAENAPELPKAPVEPIMFENPAMAEPAPSQSSSAALVASMRQALAQPQPPVGASAEPPALGADKNAASGFAPDSSLDADMPLEPGTGQPKRMISDELAALLDEPLDGSASPRNDFLALARQAISGAPPAPQDPKEAAKAAKLAAKAAKKSKSARTDHISTTELAGTPKAAKSRKVVPLLGAAAVMAAATVGGVMWMRTPNGDALIQTNAIGDMMMPSSNAEEQALPEKPAKPVKQVLVAPENAPSTSQEPEAPAAANPAPTPRKIDTTASIDPAREASATLAAPNDASAINAFAQWPTGQAIETADVAQMKKTMMALAEKGDAAAQYDLGVRLAEGRGMEPDLKSAVKWLEKAAKQGLAPAQFRIGSMYREGKGVAANNERALDWFKRAAQRGNARAMHNLAVVLAEGVGGAPDYAGAGEWFRKAAEYGIKDSQYNVAILYARGLGLPQDLSEAYRWFDAAAKQGDADAGKKRDELISRIDANKLALVKEEASAFIAKPLDPVANDVIVPSYTGAPTAEVKRDAGKKN